MAKVQAAWKYRSTTLAVRFVNVGFLSMMK
jgi:hypothetical protein